MSKSLLIILLVVLCQSAYIQNRKFALPTGTFDMTYTNNQERLIIIAQNPNGINVYDGFTAKSLQNITLPNQFVPETLTVSQDSEYLAVGSNTGGVKIFSQQNGSTVKVKQFNYTSQSKVNGLAFSPNNDLLAIGIFTGQIQLWKWQTEASPSLNKDFGVQLFGLVWSPSNDIQFWVGGGVNGVGKLVLYQLTVENQTVTDFIEKQTLPQQGNQVVSDLASTSNRQENAGKVYRVGSNNIIYDYDADSLAIQSITLTTFPQSALSKIQVTNNEEFITVQTTGNTIDLKQTNDSSYEVETHTNALETFAMSPSGGNLIIAQNVQTADVLGQCAEGQFYDSTSRSCVACQSNCNLCFDSASECKECGQRYYLDNKLCVKCQDGCSGCVDGNSCTSCRTQDGFIPDGNLCKCADGTFDQNDACLSCVNGCKVCDNTQTCQTCWEQRGFGPDGSNLCKCKQRFYDNNNTCEACIRGCFNCTNGQSCNECDNANHYIFDNNTCVCNNAEHYIDGGSDCICERGYFEQTNVCEQCPMGCTACSTISNCSECDPDKSIRDGVCKCPVGQYINDQDLCLQCSSAINHCIECDKSTQCLKCEENVDREPKDGKCACVQKFFEQNDTCVACGMNGCLECTSTSVCTSCDANNNWEENPDNQQCKCMKKYVQINNLCENCPTGCDICTQNRTCEQCSTEDHFISDGAGGCKCAQFFYFNSNTSTCEDCIDGCKDCTNGQTCEKCSDTDHFIINETDKKCICETKYFINNKLCTLCNTKIERCQECLNNVTCTKCENKFKLLNPKTCGCENKKFVNGTVCSDCPDQCKTCTKFDRCTSCQDGYDLDEDSCKGDGLDTLVIVMIVVGVLAVAGAGFAIIKCIKKKRSPLEEEGYETMQSPE